MTEKGNQLVEPTPEQQAKWEKIAGDPYIEQWIEENPGGEKVLAAYKKIYAELKASN